jgi:molybdenum cofactor cytidylyltransferase
MQDSGSNRRACDADRAGDFAVAILAAGRSLRMGSPKLLLPWGDTSILGHLAEQWRGLGAKQIAIVCGAGDETIAGELDRLGFSREHRIINPDPDEGMFSSIRCAARWSGWRSGIACWVLALGDQPQLRPDTLRELLALAKDLPRQICLPAFKGRPRHPVLLPAAEFAALADSAAATLKEFLDAHETSSREMNDPGLGMDIDTPEAYQRVLRYSFPAE